MGLVIESHIYHLKLSAIAYRCNVMINKVFFFLFYQLDNSVSLNN